MAVLFKTSQWDDIFCRDPVVVGSKLGVHSNSVGVTNKTKNISCMLCGTEVYHLIYNPELPEGYQPRARRGAQHMGTASPVSLGSGSSDEGSDGSTPPEYDFNSRRRSRAVLYHLSGTFDKRQSAKSKLQLNKVSIVTTTKPC